MTEMKTEKAQLVTEARKSRGKLRRSKATGSFVTIRASKIYRIGLVHCSKQAISSSMAVRVFDFAGIWLVHRSNQPGINQHPKAVVLLLF
ncbi:hypothetical protein L1987_34551 [Smallanthus sonchifolius]|uniref:Uncharacterized protein n=1 Tax=Smallanthus sonchifolius TaxID=185202 RepID=A0ACB9HTZ7_9ASTR|nr:hypothetical protein L1987_34551 [Smallanthus sonchifolius]